jgi:hypothetical protein
MKGLFIPEITAEMFRNGSLESIETLMAEGEIYDIEYSPSGTAQNKETRNRQETAVKKAFIELGAVIEYLQEKTGESFCVPAALRSAALIFDFDTKLMKVVIDDTVDRRKAEREGKE